MKAEDKVHSLTVRDVQLNEAGQVKLTAKDFQTEANLIVKGKTTTSGLLSHHQCPCGDVTSQLGVVREGSTLSLLKLFCIGLLSDRVRCFGHWRRMS